jgi:hypothetical protein
MQYGVLKYSKSNNVGDQIQSLAAAQYLPQIDQYIDRDFLNDFQSEQRTKLIMNGWFMAKPDNWPPSKEIDPLFVAFHITQDHRSHERMLTPESLAYFKKHEPIGCRDFYTQNLLEKNNVNAYYSGCLTMTLPSKYQHLPKSNEIIVMDLLYKTQKKSKDILGYLKKHWILKQLLPKEVLNTASFLIQDAPRHSSEELKFEMAEALLERYARAKLVVTSRIHCALPCLAMGTPVLFINGDLDQLTDTTRFKGVTEYLNVFNAGDIISEYPGALGSILKNKPFSNPTGMDWNNPPVNPERHLDIVAKLRRTCDEFISRK